MNSFLKILNSATMGQPRRLRPLIWWTVVEYFFRGAPYLTGRSAQYII